MVQKNSDFIDFLNIMYSSVVLCNKYRQEHRSHSFVLRTLFCYLCQNTVTIIRACVSVQGWVILNYKQTPLHAEISKIPDM